jgi:hypothetical protein
MTYSRKQANDFWYEFDNYFAWEFDQHPEADLAYRKIRNLSNAFMMHRKNRTFPQGFVKEIRHDLERVSAIMLLADIQLNIISKHFGDSILSQQLAFEDFGQGVLYDDRPPRWPEARIHMMDDDLFGYYRWHVFIRALVLLLSEEMEEKISSRWLYLDRHVGIASAIHYQQKPRQSGSSGNNPNNPKIDHNILSDIRSVWLQLNFEQLDVAFDQYVDFKDI